MENVNRCSQNVNMFLEFKNIFLFVANMELTKSPNYDIVGINHADNVTSVVDLL